MIPWDIRLLRRAISSTIADRLFVEFVGPTKAEVRAAGPSPLAAFVQWWQGQGLAVWPDKSAASEAMSELRSSFGHSWVTVPLPWRLMSADDRPTGQIIPWWPGAEAQAGGRLLDSPAAILGHAGSHGSELMQVLLRLIDIAGAGAHNVTVVDRYAFVLKNRSRLDQLITHAASLRSRGHGVGRLTVLGDWGEADASDRVWWQRTSAAKQWVSAFACAGRFDRVFHDRFVLVHADDRAGAFGDRPDVICLLLGKGLDALSGDPGSFSTVARLPWSGCGPLTQRVNRELAQAITGELRDAKARTALA